MTGGTGFLGSHVVCRLREKRCAAVFAPRRREFDLRDQAQVARLYGETHPTLVIHLAAVVGGIGANRERPGEFFYDNLMMGAHLFHQAWKWGVPKFVAVGTICAYPKHTPVPFKEEHLWDGYPEETNAPYGLAKKIAARAVAGLPRTIRLQLDLPAACESVRAPVTTSIRARRM